MSFSSQLEFLIVEDWRQYYVDYNKLKRRIHSVWSKPPGRKRRKKNSTAEILPIFAPLPVNDVGSDDDDDGDEEDDCPEQTSAEGDLIQRKKHKPRSRAMGETEGMEREKDDVVGTGTEEPRMSIPLRPLSRLGANRITSGNLSTQTDAVLSSCGALDDVPVQGKKQDSTPPGDIPTQVRKRDRVSSPSPVKKSFSSYEAMGLAFPPPTSAENIEEREKRRLFYRQLVHEVKKANRFYQRMESLILKSYQGLRTQAKCIENSDDEDDEDSYVESLPSPKSVQTPRVVQDPSQASPVSTDSPEATLPAQIQQRPRARANASEAREVDGKDALLTAASIESDDLGLEDEEDTDSRSKFPRNARAQFQIGPKVSMLTSGDKQAEIVKDNLRTSFIHLNRQCNLLCSFSYLNYTSVDRILKSFDKRTSTNCQNDFRVQTLDQLYFVRSRKIPTTINKITRVFAQLFEDSDIDRAKVRLMDQMTYSYYGADDMFRFGTKFGFMLCLAFLIAYCLFLVSEQNKHVFNFHEKGYYLVYRCCGLLIAWLWFWGANIYIWQRFRINYVIVFELDPRNHLSYQQVLEEACNCTIVYLLNLLLFLSAEFFDLFDLWHVSENVFPLGLFGFVVLKLCFPGNLFSHWNSRRSLLSTLMNILIAPFGTAKFKDSYVGDVLTSMAKILVDLSYIACFLPTGSFFVTEDSECGNYKWLFVPIVTALPLWCRFQQVIRQYYDTRQKWPHFGNLLKYAVCHTVVFFGAFHPLFSQPLNTDWDVKRILWVVSASLASLYTFFWDCKMDWGLFDLEAPPQHRFLRRRLLYVSAWPYYLAIVSNFILRFTWAFFTITPVDWTPSEAILVPILGFLELYRRFQWGLLRVEYEHVNGMNGGRKISNQLPFLYEAKEASSESERRRKAPTEMQSGYVLLETLFMTFLLVLLAFFSAIV